MATLDVTDSDAVLARSGVANSRGLIEAIGFAARKHSKQRRRDAEGTPYINHPIAVMRLLSSEAGIDDLETLTAAVLHDTIEDTDTTREELETLFGTEVSLIVCEVSDDKSLSKGERKRLQVEHAASLSYKARLVKLADKTCNLRDLLHTPPVEWPLWRRREYFEWSAEVVNGIRGTHATLEALFDAEYAQRPRG